MSGPALELSSDSGDELMEELFGPEDGEGQGDARADSALVAGHGSVEKHLKKLMDEEPCVCQMCGQKSNEARAVAES